MSPPESESRPRQSPSHGTWLNDWSNTLLVILSVVVCLALAIIIYQIFLLHTQAAIYIVFVLFISMFVICSLIIYTDFFHDRKPDKNMEKDKMSIHPQETYLAASYQQSNGDKRPPADNAMYSGLMRMNKSSQQPMRSINEDISNVGEIRSSRDVKRADSNKKSVVNSGFHSPHVYSQLGQPDQVTPSNESTSMQHVPIEQLTQDVQSGQMQQPESVGQHTIEQSPASYVPPKPIYEQQRNPDDYNEGKAEYPHEKLYPNQEEKSLQLAYNWSIIGASRRGYGHGYDGKYREDDFAVSLFSDSAKGEARPQAALIAISDGVGSRSHSRYGAYAAVQGATHVFDTKLRQNIVSRYPAELEERDESYFATLIAAVEQDPKSDECRDLARTLLLDAIKMAYYNVYLAAEELRSKLPNLVDADLHSTLLLFLVIPMSEQKLFIASMQVGDGALFARLVGVENVQRASQIWETLQQAQIQETGNEVRPLLKSNKKHWGHHFRCSLVEPALFVMGMTDGTADDIEPPRSPDADTHIFVEDFYQHIERIALTNANPSQGLLDFLGYKKAQSYDDRTVVCCYQSTAYENSRGDK